MEDMNIFHFHPEFFSYNLGYYCISSLAHIRSACEHIDFTVIIHLDDSATTIGFINSGATTNMYQRR